MSVLSIVIRGLVGGVIVAAVPVVAHQFGARLAGVLATVPIVVVVSLLAVGQGEGRGAAATVALRTIPSLVAVAGYLLVAWYAYRLGLPLVAVPIVALAAWVGIAVVVVRL